MSGTGQKNTTYKVFIKSVEDGGGVEWPKPPSGYVWMDYPTIFRDNDGVFWLAGVYYYHEEVMAD